MEAKKEPKMHAIRRLKYTQLAHLLEIKRYSAIQMVKRGAIKSLTVADYGRYQYEQGWNAAIEEVKKGLNVR